MDYRVEAIDCRWPDRALYGSYNSFLTVYRALIAEHCRAGNCEPGDPRCGAFSKPCRWTGRATNGMGKNTAPPGEYLPHVLGGESSF